MPDFLAFVRSRLEPLELPCQRELQIVEELAAQLEDAYDALLSRGLSEADAWRELQRGLPDWKIFAAQVLEAEGAIVRATQPARAPVSLPHSQLLNAAGLQVLGTTEWGLESDQV